MPVFGAGIFGKSSTVTRQRRLNCYLEQRVDGDKEKAVVYGTPGLSALFTLAIPGPIRGMYGTQQGLFVVASNQFYVLGIDGGIVYQATIATSAGRVTMVSNEAQLLMVDGVSSYVYVNGALIQTPGFPATRAQTCTYVQGFFVAEQPGNQQFWTSNPYDATTWGALGEAFASQYSDTILAVDNTQGMLACFGYNHVEFFQNSGNFPVPWASIQNTAAPWGLAAVFSRAQINNGIMFLAESQQGTRHVCFLLGLTVTEVSNPDLCYILAQIPIYSDAVALTYVVDGHAMYQLTLPSAPSSINGRTFLYDTLTGFWSEAQTGVSAVPARHTADLSCSAYGVQVLSDYAVPTCYTPSSNVYTDNGVPIKRELVTRHLTENTNVFGIDEFLIDMETGTAANPKVSLQVSKDNGHTFGLERWTQAGVVGNNIARVVWRRLGSGRDFVIRICQTDPGRFVLTGAKASVRERPQ